jgi:polyisoprenoid-binding protein YceI
MRTSKGWILTALLTAATLAAGSPRAETFVITPGEVGCEVRFVSKAPLETVEGKTAQIAGRLDADLSDLAAGVTLSVEVDLASLDTGIALRNRHMRENHLHVEQYPKAVFKAGRVLDPPAQGLRPGVETTFRLEGELILHGVTRPLTAPITARLREDGGLEIATTFELRLADFSIPRPKFLVMKLDEVQHINVRLVALPIAETESAEPDGSASGS